MSYKATPYTLPPGERVTIQVVGREVAVIEADKDFLIATNDGEPEFIAAGLQLAPEGGFHNIVMRNPHVDPVNVRLGITDGSIKDNRASVTTTLPVRDPDDLSSFSDAQMAADRAAILAMMQNSDDQRVGVNSLGASNFMLNSISGSASVLIDPSLNTNGAILRWFRGFSNTSSNHAVYIDTAAPSGPDDATKRRVHYTLGIAEHYQLKGLPLEIPSGNGLLVIGTTGDSIRIQGGFDLL